MKDNSIVYRLYKDNSPVVIPNLSTEGAEVQLKELKAEGYSDAYITTNEKANKVLDDFGKSFIPRSLTKAERWLKWAIGE